MCKWKAYSLMCQKENSFPFSLFKIFLSILSYPFFRTYELSKSFFQLFFKGPIEILIIFSTFTYNVVFAYICIPQIFTIKETILVIFNRTVK